MKTLTKTIMILISMLITSPVFAMDMNHGGDAIRTATVDGTTLTYQLIDMRESMKKMGHDHAMGDMATHHLMVYAKGPDGPVKGKAGFSITGPDGKTKNTMCMAMGDGFGADIHLTDQGTYTIKTKVAGQGKSLMDEFTYTLK